MRGEAIIGCIIGVVLDHIMVRWNDRHLYWVKPPGFLLNIPVLRKNNSLHPTWEGMPKWLRESIVENGGLDGAGVRWV